jgi:DNA-binding transcriptional ArsR family regulator
MLSPIEEVILRKLCLNKLSLRAVRPFVLNKSLSTIREHVKTLIENGYMTAVKSPKGYYLSRSYALTKKGERVVES